MNHPLFHNAREDDKREIAWINVTRFERTGQIWHPRAFKADELQGHDDITGMFGGGSYELIAREASSRSGGIGVIVDRVRVNLPGRSIPFDAKPSDDDDDVPAAVPIAIPSGLGDQNAMFMAILQMQQAAQAESTKLMVGMFTAIIPALVGKNDGGGSVEMIRAMGEMQKAHTEALGKVYEGNRGGGAAGGSGDASPMDALMQGLELGQAMGEKGAQEPSDLAIVMQGVTAALQAPKPNTAPPGLNGKNGAS